MARTIVLFSGGLDSTVCLTQALAESRDTVIAISFDYGQRHRAELDAAHAIVQELQVGHGVGPRLVHRIVDARFFAALGGSALTDPTIPVPAHRDGQTEIPATYVPARNLIFLSIALAIAELHSARRIVIGANAIDYSGYPDCRPAFLAAFEAAANLAVKDAVVGEARFEVVTPLLHLSKADIIRLGRSLGAPMHLSHSCYAPVDVDPAGAVLDALGVIQGGGAGPNAGGVDEGGRFTLGRTAVACGTCDACVIRRRGFHAADVPDPTPYAVSLPLACHRPAFDEEAAAGLSAAEVRRRWPRFAGRCAQCGAEGVEYASMAHMVAGDW